MPQSAIFRQFVLKVHSRCDLACDHCYIYEHADQSWRDKPDLMAVTTMARASTRIADHVRLHKLTGVSLILHGGEPLLAGHERLKELITAALDPFSNLCEVDLQIHTNGVLLDTQFCTLFRERDVKVGISLDGDREANDRHRLYRNRRSSYDKTIEAIDLLRNGFPDLYAGLLCTIDVANDPIAVYDALLTHKPPSIDFLLPHHTWDRPPPPSSSGTPYADWLMRICEKWLAQGRPVRARTFESIKSTSRGGDSFTESLGLGDSDLLVIETDGSYEQADSLKAAYHGAPATGLNVFAHSIEEVAPHPGIVARQGGLASLCATCRACPVVASCGGGLYAHRYRSDDGSGFANPSVYCKDLYTLIDGVQRLTTMLPAVTLQSVATGYGDPSAIAQLKYTQTIGCRSLLGKVGGKTSSSAAWPLLDQLNTEDPEALDPVLAHPYVRVWAANRLGELERGATGADDGLFATVACVAAARARKRVTLTVPVRNGAIYFPTIGRYTVPGRGSTTVEVEDGNLHVVGTESVELVRRLTAGSFNVVLDDLYPYRNWHNPQVAERLGAAQYETWQARFQEAWTLLEQDYEEYARAIVIGLSTIVPLEAPGSDSMVSSATRVAFGLVGIALPDSPAMLCLRLLHEFQHVKLGAVLDYVDLYNRQHDRGYRVPWRPDPRPIDELLRGTYAHIAVVDFWRRRASAPQADVAAEGARQFARLLPQTLKMVEELQRSGALTGLGEQFVARMGETLASWHDPV